MGGMSAFIPIKSDKEANDRAIAQVVEDKLREVKAGHDGTWVRSHPHHYHNTPLNTFFNSLLL